jgi:uncharacterized protein (TIGR00369 family)
VAAPAAFDELREHVNASPYYRHLGFEVETLREHYARLVMPVREELYQFQGAVHGGAIYSLGDAAVAIALLTVAESGEQVVTIEGKLNFLAPVREGQLVAEGRIVHRGRRIALGEADVLLDGRDGLVAKGLFTYTLWRPR